MLDLRTGQRQEPAGLFLAVARGRLADEKLALFLVLDLVGKKQVQLRLVLRLHGRALDHDACYRADVLGEPALGALEDLEREAAGGKGRRRVAELRRA